MTSQINTDIDVNFPVAGQDNDSVGFRNNFSTIKDGLDVAAAEITDLQTRAVVVATPENTVADNDLLGSGITNGYYRNFFGVSTSVTADGSNLNIDTTTGHVIEVELQSGSSLTLTNWPDSGYAGIIKLHLKTDGSGTKTPKILISGGTVIPENDMTGVTQALDDEWEVTVEDNTVRIIEISTITGSSSKQFFMRQIGTFTIPV